MTSRECSSSLKMTHEEQAPLLQDKIEGHHQVILTTEDLLPTKWAAILTREVHHLAFNRTVDHLQVIRVQNHKELQIQTCLETQIL